MKDKLLFGSLLICIVSIVLGCGPKQPDGMPKLYPCVLNLTQDGKPAEGFEVQLVSKGETIPWMIGGVSDAQGTVKIVANGNFDGAPAGLFAVVIHKTLTEGVDQSAEVQTKPIKIYTLIEEKFNSEKTTPLEIKIEGKTSQNLDLGKPVKILTETIKP